MATVWVDDRSKLPKRRLNDLYETAEADVRRGLDFLWDTMAREDPLKRRSKPGWAPTVLDPGAGSGSWGTVLLDYCRPRRLVGVEVRLTPRPGVYDKWLVVNFLESELMRVEGGYDLVVGNPVYEDVHLWVERSLQCLADGGYLLFLLRLTFLESLKRGDGLFAEHPPLRIGFCKRRPSFTGDGRSSPDAYCYVCWKKGWHGEGTHTWV